MEAGPVRRGPGSHLRPGNERGEIRHCGGLALQRPQARLGGDACGRRRVILRVCVYGAEAIGGFIGLRLAMAGHEVSVVARGATLEAIQKYGLRARTSEGLLNADVAASEDPGALGPQDLVIIAVKTPSLAQIAGKIDPLLGQETVIVTAMNGIPWWFFHGFGGSCEDKSLDTVEPDGVIAAGISSARVIGGVVHGSWKVEEPGLVQHVAGNRLIVGEPAGGKTQRAKMVADTLTNAGYDVEISSCIQREIWYKLLGNMTMNPISALTGATCYRILDDPLVGRFTLDIMAEAGRRARTIYGRTSVCSSGMRACNRERPDRVSMDGVGSPVICPISLTAATRASISTGLPASTSCSIDVLNAPSRRVRAFRSSPLCSMGQPIWAPMRPASAIMSRVKRPTRGSSRMRSQVAPVRADMGFIVMLPSSLYQISRCMQDEISTS